MFERFVSLDGHGGSGLGLAIAREVARRHGGDLNGDRGPFVLNLPAVAADPGRWDDDGRYGLTVPTPNERVDGP